jgi:phage anti-repressor protein
MVHEQLGYKHAKSMMAHFYEKLTSDFEDVIDYQEVNKSHLLVESYSLTFGNRKPTSNRKKHFIITGETYKALLSSANTQQGKLTRKYFIKVERLANLTNQAIFKYIEAVRNRELAERDNLLQESKEQIEKLERKQLQHELAIIGTCAISVEFL